MVGIATVGLPGSGKSTFASVAGELGFVWVEWSDVLRVDLVPEPTSREQAFCLAAELVQLKGAAFYPEKIYHGLSKSSGVGHVISGARNAEELMHLKAFYKLFRTVWVVASYQNRFERCTQRRGLHRSADLEAFLRNDMFELQHGLAELFCVCVDDIVLNDSSLDDFRWTVQDYLNSLTSKKKW